MPKKERDFQPEVIADLEDLFPSCVIIKNDPDYTQGIPDLLILYMDKWAALETKRKRDARRRPNQAYYIDLFNSMSYASFISPENKEQVYHELQQTFRTNR